MVSASPESRLIGYNSPSLHFGVLIGYFRTAIQLLRFLIIMRTGVTVDNVMDLSPYNVSGFVDERAASAGSGALVCPD